MANVGVGTKSRDKRGFFVSSKEKGRREKLKNIWKRKCCNVEGDGGVSTKKKCIEAGSCNFRGRRVLELDVLARALDSGCSACGKTGANQSGAQIKQPLNLSLTNQKLDLYE